MSDKVSYIIPCYNSERWLWQAVASCYRQNLENWEAILVDDGSSDGTKRICAFLHDQDPQRIKFEMHPSNLGQNPTKKRAIQVASGNWFFALDHDNILADNTVEVLLAYAHSRGVQAASVESLLFFGHQGDLHVSDRWIFQFEDNLCRFRDVVRSFKTPASGGNYLFSREAYERSGGYLGHDDDLHGDWGFTLAHCAAGFPIAILPGSSYFHRFNPNGMYMGIARDARKVNRLHAQYRGMLMRFMDRFDSRSQQLIMKANEGYSLISDGRLEVVNGKD